MARPVVVVIVEIGGRRFSADAKIYPIVLDCGCWGHSFSGGRTIEMAISPEGSMLGMRTRTDEPFKVMTKTGPIGIAIDSTESLALQERRDHEEDMKRIARIKDKQMNLSEIQETKKAKKDK